ncbi:hypothetical protein MCERE19_02253 [Spirosomataceae bacterium]
MMDFSGFTADGVQKDNIAGIRRFWKVITKAFTGEFPTKAHVVNGQVTANALSFLPAYRIPAEYVLPNDTKNFDYELSGPEGSESWKHIIGYEMAGFSAAMVAEMMKDQNARSVFFVEDTDGNIVVVGTSVKGLKVTIQGGSGKQGGEKRGAVMTGEEVGYRWAPVPLSTASKDLWMARQKGYLATYIGASVTFTVGGARPEPTRTLLVDDVRAFRIGDPVQVQAVNGDAILPGVMGTGSITNIVGNNMTITLTSSGVGLGNPITSTQFRITLFV